MKEKVLETIKKYNLINEGDKIVVGVSGGPDSMALLHLLNSFKELFKINIYVAHINHGIRKNAKMEEEYVETYCKKNDIPFFVKHADVLKIAETRKVGTEEAGRDVRYAFFDEVLQNTGSNKIAIAHNANDRAETVIMNILRGSGISGLKGIEPKRNEKYIRPLIEIQREEIEKYTLGEKLNPKYDESNSQNIYTRNKVRNVVIPYIKEEFNPNIISTMNRLSDVATEESQFIEKITENSYNDLFIEFNKNDEEDTIILDLKKFTNLELVIKRRVILYTINKVMGTTKGIEKVNLEDIVKLCDNNIGNKFLSPVKNLKILVKNKKIFISLKKELP